jgi:hypothetical protein
MSPRLFAIEKEVEGMTEQRPGSGVPSGASDHQSPETEYIRRAMAFAEETPEARQIRQALAMLAFVLTAGPAPLDKTFPNDLASIACFGRAFRSLQAALMNALFGYTSEVPTLVRSAYEAASLGRFLAKEPVRAEQWIQEGSWVPDREVRRWIGEGAPLYAIFYKEFSRLAHPTARACLPLLRIEDERYSVILEPIFDEAAFTDIMHGVALCGLFVLFAVRNAVVHEDVLPPNWRRDLAELAQSLEPEGDWLHLERNWEREEAKYQELQARIHRAADLADALDREPGSFRNLSRTHPSDGGKQPG